MLLSERVTSDSQSTKPCLSHMTALRGYDKTYFRHLTLVQSTLSRHQIMCETPAVLCNSPEPATAHFWQLFLRNYLPRHLWPIHLALLTRRRRPLVSPSNPFGIAEEKGRPPQKWHQPTMVQRWSCRHVMITWKGASASSWAIILPARMDADNWNHEV